MTMAAEQWRYLRTKTDETADDPDWVATNDIEAGGIDYVDIDARMPEGAGASGRPYTGIEVVVVGVDASRAVQDRASMTIDIQLVERFSRESEQLGGAIGLESVLCDSAVTEDVPLQRKVYFPLNGASSFTIRLLGDVGDAVDNLEVWWRAVSAGGPT